MTKMSVKNLSLQADILFSFEMGKIRKKGSLATDFINWSTLKDDQGTWFLNFAIDRNSSMKYRRLVGKSA